LKVNLVPGGLEAEVRPAAPTFFQMFKVANDPDLNEAVHEAPSVISLRIKLIIVK